MSFKEKIKLWLWTHALAKHRGTSSDFTAPVMIVIAGIVWVIMTPIIIEAVQGTDYSGWNFTGHAGAATLFNLIPFVFIAGGIVWILKKVL